MPPYNNGGSYLDNGNWGFNNSGGGNQNPGMPQLGGTMTTSQLPSVPGKIITSPDDIMAKDVPMDGTVSLFLMNDLSCVLAKQWNNRGTIDEVRFVREQTPEPVSQTQSDILPVILERLDKIETMIKKNSHYKKPYNKVYNKPDSQQKNQ